MVKTVRVHLSDIIHQEWSETKADYTWFQVLARGIETMKNFSDKEWAQTLMDVTEK